MMLCNLLRFDPFRLQVALFKVKIIYFKMNLNFSRIHVLLIFLHYLLPYINCTFFFPFSFLVIMYANLRDVCIEHINHLEGDALTLEYKCYTIFLKKFIPIILAFTFIELSFINYIFCKKSKLKNCKTFFLKQFI